MVDDEPNFVDLACLLKITPEAVLEKFGGSINASFFEAANIAGSMKLKGLVDFKSSYPGPNVVTVTDAGKAFIAEADNRSMEPLDALDNEVLKQLSGGKREPKELSASMNIRPRDLAIRIYKLNKNGLVVYELKNGIVEVMLTEAGFLKVKSTGIAPSPEAAKTQSTASATADPNAVNPQAADPNAKPKAKMNVKLAVVAVVVILVLVLAYLYVNGTI